MDLRQMRMAIAAHFEAGSVKLAQALQERGVEEIFNGIPEEVIANLHIIQERVTANEISTLTPEDSDWPSQLNDLSAPPVLLFVRGHRSLLSQRSLAIVGTRNPTAYGVKMASEFATGFVDRKWAIVSGGAYGIDSAAHKGALIAEGVTIAVTAAGLDFPYPAGNQRLFDEIVESGVLISEYLPGVTARPHRFLVRNRLIAALSKGTLVVEAAFRSGSLRTARDAAELMRPVMAIPGLITSPTSDGCHRLIGERRAELVTSVADAHELMSSLV